MLHVNLEKQEKPIDYSNVLSRILSTSKLHCLIKRQFIYNSFTDQRIKKVWVLNKSNVSGLRPKV